MSDTIALQPFVDAFAPDEDVRVPTGDFLAYAEGKLPAELIELWRTHGLGFYGRQRIALVDPGSWTGVVQTWFGPDATGIPFAVTSFGHVYHYDRPEGRDRIQCLDPHFQTNQVVAEDIVEFFNAHLPGPKSNLADLAALHDASEQAKGPLAQEEIFYFDPMLAVGGQVRLENLRTGDGRENVDAIHEAVAARRS